jgi:hypothetical protein
MEWMLQIVDELDDAFGAVRACCFGFFAEMGLLLAAGAGIGVIGLALAMGAEPMLICIAALMLALAAALAFHRRLDGSAA